MLNKGPRIIRGVINALAAAISALTVKADIYWIENVPDVVYVPLAMFGRKYIYDRRSPWYHHLVLEFPSLKPLIIVVRAIEGYLIKRSCIIVTVSRGMMREYDYEGMGKEVYVIPNYPEKDLKCPRDRRLREELGIPPDHPVFVFVGRLSKAEGIDLLARVAAALKGTKARLWILGDGPEAHVASLLARRYSHVTWFGWVERRRVPEYLASADYGLLTLRRGKLRVFYSHEGVFKLGEYIRCGLPVIASGVAPSPYYTVVSEEELPLYVRRVALGLERPRPPPPLPSWEEVALPTVRKVVESCLSRRA